MKISKWQSIKSSQKSILLKYLGYMSMLTWLTSSKNQKIMSVPFKSFNHEVVIVELVKRKTRFLKLLPILVSYRKQLLSHLCLNIWKGKVKNFSHQWQTFSFKKFKNSTLSFESLKSLWRCCRKPFKVQYLWMKILMKWSALLKEMQSHVCGKSIAMKHLNH